MEEIVDARDVLDANACTRRAFRARVLGYFRRTGPNRWDPYRFVAVEAGVLEVMPELKVQVEEEGARFRIRSRGRVLRAEWLPAEDEHSDLGPRAGFVQTCVRDFSHPPGRGVKAMIVKKLTE